MALKFFGFPRVLRNYKQFFQTLIRLFRDFKFEKLAFSLVVFAVIYYIIVFSAYTILLQETFWTQAFDSGIDDQGLWLLSRFITPFVTVRGLNLFGDSVTFYHLFIAPFFWIWNNINILYIIQTVFIALGAIPLFLYAKERLGSSFLAVSVALSFLLYPALQNLNLDQYHSEAITVFFVILTVFFLLKKNFSLFYAFLIISLLGKDEVAVTAVFIGLFLIFFMKELKHGGIVMAISVLWYLLCSRVFMPWFNGIGVFASQPITYSHWFQGLMGNLFNPAFYWQNFTHPDSLVYYFYLLIPVVFVPLFSLKFLFLLFPSVAVNVLSGTGYLRSIFYHYNYIQSAIMFFALTEGLRFLKSRNFSIRFIDRHKVIVLGLVVLFFALVSNNALSHLPLNRQWSMIAEKYRFLNSKSVQLKKEALKIIPKQAKVSASFSIVPQLTHRKEIYMFPNPFRPTLWNQWFQEGKGAPPAKGHVDYIAVDLGNHGDEEQLIIRYLMESPRYEVIHRQGSLLIMQHKVYQSPPNQGANYVLYSLDQPVVVRDDFSEKLRVLKTGTLSMVCFPGSRYYFRNLLGEEVPLLDSRGMALQVFGYLFVPETGDYNFKIYARGKSLLEIDNKEVRGGIRLSKGFHKYKLSYLNQDPFFELRVVVIPPSGQPYIIADKDLVLRHDPDQFSRMFHQYEELRRKREAFLRHQPNRVGNGGFEEAYGNKPKAWEIVYWQDEKTVASYVLDPSVKKRGRYSAKIEQNGLADARWVQEVELKPDTYYKLSGWIKTKDVARNGAGAHLEVEGAGFRTEEIFGTQDWKYVEVTGKTGGDQARVKVLCRLGGYGSPNSGTAFFDEIELKEIYEE